MVNKAQNRIGSHAVFLAPFSVVMKLEFQDVHIFTVVFLVLVLIFIRTIASTLVELLHAIESLCSASCLSLGCGLDESAALYLLRCVLILFCFSQPVIFAGIHYARSVQHKPTVSVLFVERINSEDMACVKSVYNTSTIWDVSKHDPMVVECFGVRGSAVPVKVDALLVILPFAFAVSINSLTWLHYSKRDVLNVNSMWDDSLSADLFYYELSHVMERFTSNFCFLALYSTGTGTMFACICALLFTLIQFFYAVISRISAREWQLQTFSVLLLIVLISIWTPLWMNNLASYDWLAILLLSTHTITVFVDIFINLLAEGSLMATQIILFRLILQCLSSVSIIVFLCSQ